VSGVSKVAYGGFIRCRPKLQTLLSFMPAANTLLMTLYDDCLIVLVPRVAIDNDYFNEKFWRKMMRN
jgi:hypothetical protein